MHVQSYLDSSGFLARIARLLNTSHFSARQNRHTRFVAQGHCSAHGPCAVRIHGPRVLVVDSPRRVFYRSGVARGAAARGGPGMEGRKAE